MSSLIEGYNYDIFISYRQKDNRHDGWVTEFVNNLKGELESTFKEEISVYLDINPHDGLLETHDVDASLKEKLKCLIFIPIISRTYCDPKSFAWEHEFKAFVEMTLKDQFGLKVKLANGNIANRVLPIQIHKIATDDKEHIERELGGILRPIEFIYKEPGVNRPLRSNEDHPANNLNKTFYRNQINKVANAIDEIISSLKNIQVAPGNEKSQQGELLVDLKKEKILKKQLKYTDFSNRKLLLSVIIISAFLILAILAFPKVFHSGKHKVIRDPDGRISIAVTIFDNNTNDSTLNWLRKGIPELLRSNLSNSKELSIHNSQTMYELYQSMGQAKTSSFIPSLSREAAIKLKTGTYITGSFQKLGTNILTYVKLIDTKNDELLWTGSIDGDLENYKYLADSLSESLKYFLEIKAIKQKASQEYSDVNTNSPEALRRYVEGMQMMINGNFKSAAQYFEESYASDTTFTLAALYASIVYSYDANFVPTLKWTEIAYRGKKRLSYYYQLWIKSGKACIISKNADSVLYYVDLLAQSDIKSRLFWMDIGYMYMALEQYQKAVNAFEKVETISAEWGGDWKYSDYYMFFGNACHNAGMHDKEAMIHKTGLKHFPDDMKIIYYQARCAIATGDTIKATELINKLITMRSDQKWSARIIETGLGDLYAEANSIDKAEEHYWAALRLYPNNYSLINTLAYLLIKYDRDIDKAEELVNKSLRIKPDNANALYNQGLIWYKQGKYEEALNIMQLAYTKFPTWNVSLFNDIKKVKAAIANQN